MLQKKKPRNIANRETPRDDKFSDKTDGQASVGRY